MVAGGASDMTRVNVRTENNIVAAQAPGPGCIEGGHISVLARWSGQTEFAGPDETNAYLGRRFPGSPGLCK
jgi:hypothetical protein